MSLQSYKMARHTRRLYLASHFLQNSHDLLGTFAERDLQVQGIESTLPPCVRQASRIF